jgi:hypothetical protein
MSIDMGPPTHDKIVEACPAGGIPLRVMRHADVGIALAPCICLNKPVCSHRNPVFLG